MGKDTAVTTISVQLRSVGNRRSEERYIAQMPVQVGDAAGTTQDLSSRGLSFVTDRSYEVGARLEVVIEYLLDGHQYPLECEAEIVRVDPVPEGFRIGARLKPLG